MKTTYLKMLAGALAVVTVVGCNNASERKDETQANQTMQPAEHAAPCLYGVSARHYQEKYSV
ncbi:hypothetical protein [Rufibacter sp. LB8]|uniref:hypothetical protein n=1 Tax=Rufibacter sp. LB8 TaxID=2777781 RepID=UPI001CEF665E|nr:hypothetical protein [Rufibacter sp. LB8]